MDGQMELFVVNRHNNIDDEASREPSNEQQEEKLNITIKKIERNKIMRNKEKEKGRRTTKARPIKRKIKRKKFNLECVRSNTNDGFFDTTNVDENRTELGAFAADQIKQAEKRKQDSVVEGFTILGTGDFKNREKVKRVLPRWVTNPTVISANLQELETRVADIESLDKQLQKLLNSNGILSFFPVQAKVIPWLIESNRHTSIMCPRDVCVSAPTGSGKTLAFVLPVIQMIKKYSVKKIRALVILPTQDLARQVYRAFKVFSKGTNIDTGLIIGQNSFEIEQKQIVSKNNAFGYITKADILVCTAGRLVDHLKMTEGFDLHFLEFLIIDEADRVLESIQNDWLYHLEKHLWAEGPPRILNQYTLYPNRPPQKLLFSATLSQDPEKLQQLSLFQPKLFTSVVETSDGASPNSHKSENTFIGKYTTPKELTEKYIETSLDLKPLVLYKLIKNDNLKKTLVFTHSVESTHRLTIFLRAMFKDQLTIQEISSHLQPKDRVELINQFSEGNIDILISTDALARGMDLPDVQCVISYSAPKYLKSYIHRAGRTARAGQRGLAVTFLHSSQLVKFKALLKQAGKNNVKEAKISEEGLEPLGEQYKESLGKLRRTVEQEENVVLKRMKSSKTLKLKYKKTLCAKLN